MKTKLKIGDKVRVINKDDNFYGRIGKIVRIERFTQFPLRVLFEDNVGVFTTSELQLIKPVRKWKYTRKELVAKYSYDNNYYTSNMCKDLLAKSEHTEDKSDMLAKKDSVEQEPGGCGGGDLPCGTFTRPTLKPIEKVKPSMLNYPSEMEAIVCLVRDVFEKQQEVIDRINLLTENYKLSKEEK